MSDHKNLIDSGLLELYAMGKCSTEQLAMIEAALMQDDNVSAEFEAICLTLENVAKDNAIQAPKGIKAEVLGNLDEVIEHGQETEKEAPESTKEQDETSAFEVRKNKEVFASVKEFDYSALPWMWIAAAAFILLVGSIAMNFTYSNRLQSAENRLADLQQQKFLLTDENGILGLRYDSLKNSTDFLSTEGLRAHTLKASPGYEGNSAVVFMDSTGNKVKMTTSGLSPLPAGYQYQLWSFNKKVHANAGFVQPNRLGEIVDMKSVGKFDVLAITIETTAGAEKPTLDKIVVFTQL